jgi:hypothetical protein
MKTTQRGLFGDDERPLSSRLERKRAKNRRQSRSWYQRHPEQAKTRHRQYVERNKARVRAKQREWYERNKLRLIAKASERHRQRGRSDYLTKLAKQYHTTVDCLLKALGKLCPICRKRTATALDHSHESGQFRGGLCERCNHGLGQFEDSIPSLRRAIKYLQRCEREQQNERTKKRNIINAARNS